VLSDRKLFRQRASIVAGDAEIDAGRRNIRMAEQFPLPPRGSLSWRTGALASPAGSSASSRARHQASRARTSGGIPTGHLRSKTKTPRHARDDPGRASASLATALNIMFSPVAYMNQDKVHATMNTVIENINAHADFLPTLDRQTIISWAFCMLLTGVTCVKHEGFSEEQEWRAIHTPKRASSPLMASSTEVIGGIPQIIYQMPLDKSVSPALEPIDLAAMFDRLIVGPSSYPWAMYEAFVDALSKAGVTDAGNRVVISGILLRA
jgi:hypothetical protein